MERENSTYNDFSDLVIRFFNGENTEKEIELLKQWVRKSEENKNQFLEMKAVWGLTAQSQKANQADVSLALDELNKRIQVKHEELLLPSKFSFKWIVKIAAAFLLAVSISSLTTYYVISNKNNIQSAENKNMVIVYAPLGAKAMTVLPDGTKIWLNAGSKLTYAINYNNSTRIVKLEGEGFFDVKTNAKKPFVVKAKGLDIKAYGTAFNVKAYLEEKEIVTTLVRGKVYIEGKDKKNKDFVIQMKPKQSITYLINKETEGLKPLVNEHKTETNERVDTELKNTKDANLPFVTTEVEKTELYTSWKDTRWIIKGEEIGKLAISLERKYNIEIVFKSVELKKYRFTGIFQNETVEQVFQVLKMTAPLRYEISQGNVTLSIDESLKMKFKKYITANEQNIH